MIMWIRFCSWIPDLLNSWAKMRLIIQPTNVVFEETHIANSTMKWSRKIAIVGVFLGTKGIDKRFYYFHFRCDFSNVVMIIAFFDLWLRFRIKYIYCSVIWPNTRLCSRWLLFSFCVIACFCHSSIAFDYFRQVCNDNNNHSCPKWLCGFFTISSGDEFL